MGKKQLGRIWVVVRVYAGIPAEVEAYQDFQMAKRRERLWRKSMHPENDETGVFETTIKTGTSSATHK